MQDIVLRAHCNSSQTQQLTPALSCSNIIILSSRRLDTFINLASFTVSPLQTTLPSGWSSKGWGYPEDSSWGEDTKCPLLWGKIINNRRMWSWQSDGVGAQEGSEEGSRGQMLFYLGKKNKINVWRKEWVCFSFLFHSIVCHSGTSGQEHKQHKNLVVGADAEAMGECCLLACSVCLIIHSRTTCPGVALPTMGWAFP